MNFSKVQRRKGIGTVITTLIVLIASVVLGAGVIFFGGSLFQSNTEQESIQVSNAHAWSGTTAGNADSQAAFVVKNTGGKVVSINSITLRGTPIPVNAWYFNNNQTLMTVQNTQTELQFDTDGTLTSITLPSGATAFTLATGPISLQQGESAILYIENPAGIGPTDIGISYTMNVKAGQATAVQSVSVASGS